ncbi:MAG: hypothetical protein EXS05_19800 [Planctomycetaceae bacterium]|nr:hypothetical protein [Planctomycetaceae bacterium]
MGKRQPFTQLELHGFSEIVFYDFEALYRAADALKRGAEAPDSREQRWDQNFRLEAFALHCRALERFFFDANPRSTDVVAADFQLPSWFPERTRALEEAWEKAGKHVAHITTLRNGLNRSPANESRWPVFVCLNDICRLMEHFLKIVPPANLKPGIERFFAMIIKEAENLAEETGTVGTGGSVATSLIQEGSVEVNRVSHLEQALKYDPRQQWQAMTAPTQLPPADLTTT